MIRSQALANFLLAAYATVFGLQPGHAQAQLSVPVTQVAAGSSSPAC